MAITASFSRSISAWIVSYWLWDHRSSQSILPLEGIPLVNSSMFSAEIFPLKLHWEQHRKFQCQQLKHCPHLPPKKNPTPIKLLNIWEGLRASVPTATHWNSSSIFVSLLWRISHSFKCSPRTQHSLWASEGISQILNKWYQLSVLRKPKLTFFPSSRKGADLSLFFTKYLLH